MSDPVHPNSSSVHDHLLMVVGYPHHTHHTPDPLGSGPFWAVGSCGRVILLPAILSAVAVGLCHPVVGSTVSSDFFGSSSERDTTAPQARREIHSVSNVAHIFARTFTSRNAVFLAGGAAGALAAHHRDRETQAWWQDRRPPKSVIRTADMLGDLEFQFPAILAFWGGSKLAGNARLVDTGATLAEGYVVSQTITMTLKTAAHRRRPDGSNRLSFPSGHASGSFAIATVVARRHGPVIGVPFLCGATFISAMRLAEQKHFLSDVVAGAAIGVAVGRSAAALHDSGDAPRRGLRFCPVPGYPLAFGFGW